MAFDKQLKFIISAVDKATGPIKGVSKSLGGLNQSIKNMQPAFQNMATYGGVAMGALLAGANQTINQASKLNESINAVNVVFKESSQTILDFGQNAAKSVGLSKSAFNQLATPIGAMLSNMKYGADEAATATIELTKRAADMASVFNTDVNTAMQAIQAGIRGEIDPLEKYGVSLSDASIKAYALSQGLIETNREMTNEEKTRARVALLMEQTNKLAGDFVNTSGEEANASRILNAEIENMSATIGTQLLPIKKQLLQTVGPIVEKISEWIQKNPELTKNLIIGAVAVTGLVTVLGTLGLAIPTIITGFTSLITGLTAVKFAFIAVGGPITILIALIAALAVATYTNWDKIKQGFKDGTEAVGIYMDALNTKSETHWMKMKQGTNNGVEAIKRYMVALGTNIETIRLKLINSAKIRASNMIDMFVKGITDKIQDVKDAASAVATAISSFLGFHSPTEEGPASDSDKWMPNLINMLSDGLKQGESKIGERAKAIASQIKEGIDIDGISQVIDSMVAEFKDAFNSIGGSIDGQKSKLQSLKDEIRNIRDEIKGISQDINDTQAQGASDIASRAATIMKEIDKLRTGDQTVDTQGRIDKLNEELALAKQNVSDEQIAQAEALMNRNETQVILDRMNARVVELEEKRRLLKVEYEEKKVMFENEKQAYQSMVDQKKQIDDNYFAIFGSKIEKQKKSIEDTIKMMQNLAGTGPQLDAGLVNFGSQGQATQSSGSNSVTVNLGGVTVNNEADENRLVQKIKEMLIRDDQLYNYGVL